VGSMLAFSVVIVFGLLDRVVRAAAWTYRKIRKGAQQRVSGDSVTAPSSPSRTPVLAADRRAGQCHVVCGGGYGLFFERQDVEVVRHRLRLARLPKTFDGFRIAQLSDIHMGPFSTAATSVVASRSLTLETRSDRADRRLHCLGPEPGKGGGS